MLHPQAARPLRGTRPTTSLRTAQRFLMIKAGRQSDRAAAPTSLIVVQHFDEELKRLVPR